MLNPWRRKIILNDGLLNSLPKEVVEVLQGSSKSDKEKLKVLLQHLYDKAGSHYRVAEIIGVPPSTVFSWMMRLKVNIQEKQKTRQRRLAKVKEASALEKAIMWMLTYSDGCVRRAGRHVEVRICTPDPWLVHLFTKTFSTHADVKVSPSITTSRLYWTARCVLPIEGYSWLLINEPPRINNDALLWYSLATLIDAEGSLTIQRKKGYAIPCLRVRMENLKVLRIFKDKLANHGVRVNLRLEEQAGEENKIGRFKNDLWCLEINSKSSLSTALREVVDKLTLPWKQLMAKLALSVCTHPTRWEDIADLLFEIRRLRNSVITLSKRKILERFAESPPRL